jgi:hypothetical protein
MQPSTEPNAVALFELALENLVQTVYATLQQQGTHASTNRIRRVLLADELSKAQELEDTEAANA